MEHQQRQAWFTRTILPHEPALRRHLAARFRSAADLDDVVAETLVRAYTTENFSRINRGRAYLITIARNIIFDGVRRNRVIAFDSIAQLKIDPADDAPSAERVVGGRDDVQRLMKLIDRLPKQCRRVLLLRRVHDYSPTQIADQMGLSVSTVEKHLTRALVLLTRLVAEDTSGDVEITADYEWPNTKIR